MKGYYVVFEWPGNDIFKECEISEPGIGEVLLENRFSVIFAGT